MKKKSLEAKIIIAARGYAEEILHLLDRLAEEHRDRSKFYKGSRQMRESNEKMLEEKFSQDNAVVLVAIHDGCCVGCLIGDIRAGNRNTVADFVAYAGSVYVLPVYRRQGIFHALCRKFRLWAKKKRIRDLIIEVFPKNGVGIKAWRSENFGVNLLQMHVRI